MTLREKLESDIRDAMRSRNQARLDALRFLKNGIQQAEIASRKTLDDAGIVEVVAKQIKDRRESIQMFEQGHRPDLVAKESAAVVVLEVYLPAQLSHGELVELIKKVMAEVGATTLRDKGRVMGRLMPQVRGKADGAVVNQLVSQILESGA
jgi:uncharacterized protein YqeY